MSSLFPTTPLVSAAWLAEHRQQVIVLDCSVARVDGDDGATEFASGSDIFLQQHIPQAQFADLFDGFSAADAPLLFTAPDAQQLTVALQSLGVNDDSLLVVYDQLSGAYAARVWYLLSAVYGFEQVRALDGGFAAWQRFTDATAAGAATRVDRGNVQLAAPGAALYSTAQVASSTRPLVCALRSEAFARAHIAGSLNLPYPAMLGEHGLIDIPRVNAALQHANITPPAPLLLYCGGGINAAGLALALVAAGYPLDALALYDDSLNGWLSGGQRPIERGASR